MHQGGCLYPYSGGGIVTPGAGVAVTWSPGSVTTGLNVGIQASLGASVQVGYSFGPGGGWFFEVGGGMPVGASLTAYYVGAPVCKPKPSLSHPLQNLHLQENLHLQALHPRHRHLGQGEASRMHRRSVQERGSR